MSGRPLILFAGGGTGGHIFPNLAIWERVRDLSPEPLDCCFLVSDRPLDVTICQDLGLPFLAVPADPARLRPMALVRGFFRYRAGRAQVLRLLREQPVRAMISSGGFVSVPCVAAAQTAGLPTALLNLDATPGRANRLMARRVTLRFSAYPAAQLPGGARPIGFPLRRAAAAVGEPQAARRELGLDPQRPTLLVTAGSQGARSVNRMLGAIAGDGALQQALAGWQVLHLCGAHDGPELTAAYTAAGIPARVLDFCDRMGLAWNAANLAISRAGAGSVAEVLAHAVPTLFFPYPFHKDEHQRHNAQPLVDAGGALCLQDRVDPAANLEAIRSPLRQLLEDASQRDRWRRVLREIQPEDGAEVVARWVLKAGTPA